MGIFFKKIKLNLAIFFHGLFHGLRNADVAMLAQEGGGDGDGEEVAHRLEINNVYNDLLQEKKTQDALERIDMSYRVAREANQYEVTVIGDLSDDSVRSDKDLAAVAVKKIAMKYDKHPEVFNEKGYHVTLIQANKQIPKKGVFTATLKDFVEALNTNGNDYVSLIEVNYDGFTPRFKTENFVNKAVMRETKAGKAKIDLYIYSEAGQFTKTDAIFIAELHRIKDNGAKKTDFLDVNEIAFVTDKAYGAEDYIRYSLTELKFDKISLFDGNFVLTFNVGKVNTFDIVEAHKTDTLTEKYDKMAPRTDNISATDVGAIERRDKKLAKKAQEKERLDNGL